MSITSWQIMTPDQLRAYINTFIIPNGQGLILGIEHNNVENNLLTFAVQAPLNWQEAKIYSTYDAVNVERPVNVFQNNAPSSLTWGDNIYNEFEFINMTNTNIPFVSGKYFFDKDNNIITYIPSHQVLNIKKAENGFWIQANNFSSSAAATIAAQELNFIVGKGSPIIMNQGDTTLTINNANILLNSVKVYIDGARIYPNATDQATFSIVYNTNSVILTFNMDGAGGGVSNNQKIIVDYETAV